MHSVLSGYTEKALTYADKAFQFMNASTNQNSGKFYIDDLYQFPFPLSVRGRHNYKFIIHSCQ